MGGSKAIVQATGTVTYGEPEAAVPGLTLVVYDGRGWERFRSPVRIEGTPGSLTLVATRPVSEGFTALSCAVIDGSGCVISAVALRRAFEDGDTFNLPISIGE
jgi:hypothetical protein